MHKQLVQLILQVTLFHSLKKFDLVMSEHMHGVGEENETISYNDLSLYLYCANPGKNLILNMLSS